MCLPHFEDWKSTYYMGHVKMTGTSEEVFRASIFKSTSTGCWIWRRALTEYGYAAFTVYDEDGRSTTGHRYAYELLVGPSPEGLELDHTCRIRPCCNPAHLEPVTQRVNTLRGVGFSAQNARKEKCPQGHPYDSENTYVSSDGYRQCAVCRRETSGRTSAERQRAYRERNGLVSGVGRGGYQKLRTHCPQGHPYSAENTIHEGNRRKCRTCVKNRRDARRAK
jgi:hypothetical protein